jgi:hypothetical protein
MSCHNRSAPDPLVPAKAGTLGAQVSLARTQPLSFLAQTGTHNHQGFGYRWPCHIALLRRMGPRLRAACVGTTGESHCFTSGQSH